MDHRGTEGTEELQLQLQMDHGGTEGTENRRDSRGRHSPRSGESRERSRSMPTRHHDLPLDCPFGAMTTRWCPPCPPCLRGPLAVAVLCALCASVVKSMPDRAT